MRVHAHAHPPRPPAQVIIVTSPSTHDHFMARATSMGFSPACLLCNPEPRDQDPVGDVVFALQQVPRLQAGYVVVAR